MKGPLRRNDPFDKGVLDSVIPCDRLIDVGPGIRPFDGFKAKTTHLCIEPHWEYVDKLWDMNYPTIPCAAIDVLPYLIKFETILFIDVIEHMTKVEGQACLECAKFLATKQVVVFTPLGFMEQEVGEDDLDAWGMHGGSWQEHKSGWTPEDFQGWDISIGRNYHGSHSAFAAVLNK